MPGVDRECVTHHACSCIQARLEQLEQQVVELETALEAERSAYRIVSQDRDEWKRRAERAERERDAALAQVERLRSGVNEIFSVLVEGMKLNRAGRYQMYERAINIALEMRDSAADRADAGEGLSKDDIFRATYEPVGEG